MEFSFDLQMFGGKGGSTTNVQSYEPSEYELQLQKAQADYANAIAPNALWLNNVARGVLQDSLGTVQVDFNELNKQAQDRIYGYSDDMADSIGDNTRQLRSTNNVLDAVSRQIPGVVNDYVNGTNGIMGSNAAATDTTNDKLGDISGAYGRNADQANAQLDRLLSKSENSLDKYQDVRDALIRGEIPSPYLQNMQDAIAGTMKRMAGEGLNNLANRGILNSSVTEGVLNDIEKNASDSVAGRFLDNISTINSLLQGQSSDSLNLLGQQANLIGQRYGNNTTALGQQGNLAQQQLGNISNANQQNAALLGQQYQNKMNGLGQQAGLANQAFNNQLGAQKQNAATLDSLLGHANDNITTAAAAQEAAQQPAANLWNMSMGLNGQTTGALAAASGKGTTTSTTTQSGGGGLFSGLLGGLF